MKYDKEFIEYITPIIENEEYQKRKKYMHHENLSVYDHSMQVAYLSFKFAKKHKLNVKDIVIGAMLHDFYYKPWQDNKEHVKFFKQHGFVHAGQALENSRKEFPELLNPMIEDIIVKHMFPLNIRPPKYKESWVVTAMDKKTSLNILFCPRVWAKYLGLVRR